MKLYVRERDSDHFVKLAREFETRAIISQFSIHEIWSALQRKEFMGAIPAGTAEMAYRKVCHQVEDAVLQVIPYGRDVALEFDRIIRACYKARPAVPIRAMDGLLLASAISARVSDLVSTDSRMRNAGLLLGLRILPS